MTREEDRLSYGEIVSYALPTFSINIIMMTVGIFLPNFYTDELGVTAAMLSWVFLFGRLWDAITDPTMGHISDRTRSRWGRRRPYFLACALPLWVSYYFIWSPLSTLSPTGRFVHLLISYIALFTFWTMFYIPHWSLGLEYSNDYHQRSRLFGGRQIFGLIGSATGAVLPVVFAKLAGSKVAGYSLMGLVVGGVCAGLIIAMFFYIKEREDRATSARYPFFQGLRITFKNRAFLILMFVYMVTMVGGSFIGPLCPFMAKYVVKREWVIQPLIISYMACSFMSIPIWLAIAKRIGKNKTWIGALLWGAAGYMCILTVGEGRWLNWILCTIPTGMATGCTMVLGPSIQADVVDSDELETGTRREGAFYGIISLIDKAAIGLAVFIGLQALSWIGYVPNIEQTKLVKNGIIGLHTFLPAGLNIIGVLVFRMFPITQEVHADIRAQLEARKADQAASESGGN